MELVLAENQRLKHMILSFSKDIPDNNFVTDNVSSILKILLVCAKNNAGRKASGMRYNSTLKEFATLCLTLGGPQLYEMLQKNLNFPSISTARRNLLSADPIQEALFRIQEVKNRLDVAGVRSRKVHVCEDATVLNGKIQYDVKTNQLVGFVTPLKNGIPVPNSFPATTASEIQSHFKNGEVAKNAYTIIVQPLESNVAPFCVALFGTNNKFQYTDVLQRWRWMEKSFLDTAGLEIDGFSSDGDGKLLKAMYCQTFLPKKSSEWPWYHAPVTTQGAVTTQDAIHLMVKLKSKLLKPSEIIAIGGFVASKGHLVTLVKEVSKDIHQLTLTTLDSKDKMNFRSAQKLCDEKVAQLLRSSIPGSDATALYLDMMREVTAPFLDKNLMPLQAVYLIWKWTFFLRLWRKWIVNTDGYTLGHNFITSNAYTCIEVNAHALIKLIRKRREAGEAHLYNPCRYTSQPNEDFYRRARSLSSTQCSMVCFSQYELLHRVRRIDFLGDSFYKLKDTVSFPRLQKLYRYSAAEDEPAAVPMPDDGEIERTVGVAFEEALQLCVQFGLASKKTRMPQCSLPSVSPGILPQMPEVIFLDGDENIDEEHVVDDVCQSNELIREEDSEDLNDVTEDLLVVSSGCLGLKSYDDVTLSPTSPFVKVVDGNGKVCIIRKTSLCWLLCSGDTRLSSDRLVRVQSEQVVHASVSSSSQCSSPYKDSTISVGDWCAFRSEDKSIVIGRILAFSYMSGATWRMQEISATSVPVKPPEGSSRRGVGCLCSWFSVKNRKLVPISMDVHGYYDIKNYICTVSRPTVHNKDLVLQCNLRDISKAS